jgi:penicillin-binding protein 2
MALCIFRIQRLMALFLIIGILLIFRLGYLQLAVGHRLAVESLSGRVQEVPVEVARGEIADRNGLSLTNTAQRFSIAVFPAQIDHAERTAEVLSEITGQPANDINAALMSGEKPFKLQAAIDVRTAKRINERKIPGVVAVAERVRYGYNPLAAHVTGYINSADNRGVSGIEGVYDEILRGNNPEYAAAIVDAGQRMIPGLGYKRLKMDQGNGPSNVILTLDMGVQKIVETVMDRHVSKGAVIVMRPSTGEVLAMASRPNFDANKISDFLIQDSAPLLNRAIAAYQPGSVFKLVIAASALESGSVRPENVFFDPGYIEVNHLRFKGWDFERGGRGYITFTDAMAYSSNPVFIEVGLKLGAEKIIDFAYKLGFGRHSGINLDGEAEGNIPSADDIYPGELANLAIGQGSLEATPLQIAGLVSTIVNDGIKVDPYIVSKITNTDGGVVNSHKASRGTRVLSRHTAAQLKAMMTAVTSYGTGQSAYVEKFGSAGKTGSAETGRTDRTGHGINHAWFAGYAPLDNPQYVVVVMVEEGMSGGDVAAPIFNEITTSILQNMKDVH